MPESLDLEPLLHSMAISEVTAKPIIASLKLDAPDSHEAMWGEENCLEQLDRVACFATIRLTKMDAKDGTFSLRMQCQWAFRTLNPKGETEISFRGVPGIRMPGLDVCVEESRIWKDLHNSTATETIFWRGTSTFLMSGFKEFNVMDFPFDRQILDLQQLHFVWRSSKEDDDYFNTMKVAFLQITPCSMLPEWHPEPALITPFNATNAARDDSTGSHVCYATKFRVELHMERKHGFYVRQIFFVTTMITIAACFPLGMPPTEDHMGDRLSVYSAGLLTLVAFKYGVMDHLPSVPYATFTDNILLTQILTIIACMFECVIVFRLKDETGTIDRLENVLLALVFVLWSSYLFYIAWVKPTKRTPWQIVRETDLDRNKIVETVKPFWMTAIDASSPISPRLREGLTD